ATTSVDLHFRGRLGDAPVMYVRTGAPAYWRGLVFDQYRDGVWTATNHDYREMQPFVPPRFLPPAPPHNLGTFVQTFRVLRPLPGVINAAYPIESLYAPVATLREDAYGTFHTPGPLRPGQTYSVVSYLPDLSPVSLRADEGDLSLSDYEREYLDSQALSARGRRLAADITNETTNPFDSVMALTSYLQANYKYTLDLPRLIPHLTVGAPAVALGSVGALAVIPVAIAIAVVVVLAYAWLRRRRWTRGSRAARGESELLRLYERLQRRLGRRRAPPETPLEYQKTMPSALLEEVTRAVNEGAYAGRWPDPARLRKLALRVPAKSRRRL